MDKKCSECVFAILHDYGYSNYTVEGTTVYCSKDIHPDNGFDRWYGQDKRNLHAENCSSFIEGSPVEIDVDSESLEKGSNPFKSYETFYIPGEVISQFID